MKPVFVSAEVSVANQAFLAPQNASTLLSNPFFAPMWIDSINIYVDNSYQDIIRTELRLGNAYLTAAPVPSLLLFEPSTQFTRVYDDRASYWQLSRPLFIPQGQFLLPRFYHSGDGGTATQSVRVTYTGRSFEPGDPLPDEYWMPYVAPYVATTRAGGVSDFTDDSSESTLRNPFSESLEIVSLNGSLLPNNGSSFTGAVEFQQTQVRGVNQDSVVVIRDGTEFFTLFGNQNAFRTAFSLPPNGFIVLYLNENYASISALNTAIHPRFSMVGYRKVKRQP